MLRLVVSEVLDHTKDLPQENAGVHRHGVELRLEALQREGEVRDIYVAGLRGGPSRQYLPSERYESSGLDRRALLQLDSLDALGLVLRHGALIRTGRIAVELAYG